MSESLQEGLTGRLAIGPLIALCYCLACNDRHHLQIPMATAVSGTDLDLKNDDEIVELEIYRSSSIPGNQGKLLHILHISLIIWIIIANNATMAI